MALYRWHDGAVPEKMEVKQVYGLLFAKDGRMVLLVERGTGGVKYSLPGGHPEVVDADMADTLRREVWEEMHIRIAEPVMLGYQEVDEEDGSATYAQVRMAARVEEVFPARPDPASGKLFERLLVLPERANGYLNWGEIGEVMVNSAVQAAQKKWDMQPFDGEPQEEWL